MRCALNEFRQLKNDQRAGRISVTLHPENVPENGDCGSVIFWTRDGYVTLQEGIRVFTIDGNN